MKRFLSVLLACLVLAAACAMGASAAPKKSFDPDAIQQCMLCNDTTGITGNGHNSVMLVDENGYGLLFSYQLSGMKKFSYTPAGLEKFMKDGLPFSTSQFQFDRMIIFDVTPEEGRRMYDHAENTEFREFYRYASFFTSVIPTGDNCTTVARSILAAGNFKYNFYYPFGYPNSTFYTLRMGLRLWFVPYTINYAEPPLTWLYHPDNPDRPVTDGLIQD